MLSPPVNVGLNVAVTQNATTIVIATAIVVMTVDVMTQELLAGKIGTNTTRSNCMNIP